MILFPEARGGGACSAEGNLETLEALAGRGRRERKILPFFYSAVLALMRVVCDGGN